MNGTLSTVSSAVGLIGGAQSFVSNSTMSVSSTPLANSGSAGTISMLVRQDDSSIADPISYPMQVLFANPDGANRLYLRVATNSLVATVKTNNVLDPNLALGVTGTWNHVALSWTPSAAKVYLNGTQVATGVVTSAITYMANLYIGSYGAGRPDGFKGLIDQTELSTVARSSNWVYACYLNQASNSVFATNFPVQSTVPIIRNEAVSNVTGSSATLNGYLSSTGGAPITAVSVYWGTNDGGTVAANWSNSVAITPIPQAVGPLSTNITGLAANTRYYYRYYATNSYGGVWADSPTSFLFVDLAEWNKKVPIQFSGYDRTEVLTNFPALVTLSTNTYGFSYADFLSSTNADLRFTDATQTNELNYEIEKWDTNGSSVVWVQVPQLTSNAMIYALWGKSGQSTPACTTNGATWESGFKGVWHLDETAFPYRDSTANRIHGTSGTAPASASGLISGGQLFTVTSSNFIDLSNTVFPDSSFFTIAAWVKPVGGGTAVGRGRDGSGTGWSLGLGARTGTVHTASVITMSGGAAGYGAAGMTTIGASDRWDYLTSVWRPQNGGLTFYVNGVQEGTNATTTYTLRDSTVGVRFGRVNDSYYSGALDEVQISNIARSSNWVWACYLNQASNNVFATFGTAGIRNEAASSVTAGSASLNGYLSATGFAPITAVSVYWGTNDGGTVAANWSNTNSFSPVPQAAGWLSTNVTGLLPDAQYYYRYYAANSYGGAWADSSALFFTDTAGLTVVATTPSASESGPVNGVFTFTRSTASTNAAMTVAYALAGTAGNGTDYANLTGQATFPVGATNTTVTVIPIKDGIAEGSETVDLTLTGGGALGTPSNATVTIADGTWYVATNGVDSNAGTNWGQAFKTVSNGVARALAGDLVLVSNGVYSVTTAILVNKGVTLQGVAGASNTFLRGPDPSQSRVLWVNHASAVVDGFTITNGFINVAGTTITNFGAGVYLQSGTVRNCVIKKNRLVGWEYDSYGAGVYMSGGLLMNCIVSDNNCQGGHFGHGRGGGVYATGGTVRECRIERNLSKGSGTGYGGNAYGGGVYLTGSAQVLNSLIVSNRAQRTTDNYEQGGGVWMDNGTLANCTVVDNLCVVSPAAGSAGGGIYQEGGTVRNGIVYFNTSAGAANDFFWSAGTRDYSCAPELTTGTGNTLAEPLFAARSNGNYRLTGPSPCMDTGTSSVGLTTDLDGTPRPVDGDQSGVAQHDMGCYEYQGGVFACDFDTASARVVLDALNNAVFTASVYGPANATNIAYYWWDFGNGTAAGATMSAVTTNFGPGSYTVALTVSNTLGEVSSAIKAAFIKVVSTNTHVSTNGAGQYPYDTWGKATTNPVLALAVLKEAVSVGAAAGDLWLSNGVFGVSEQLVLNGTYRLHGMNGATNTALRRSGATNYRVLSLTHASALAEGLTISNGYSSLETDVGGGGVSMTTGGTLKNCIIASNSRIDPEDDGYGGGVYMMAGLMTNCVVRNNYLRGGWWYAGGRGGGVYAGGGTIRDCRIEGNRLVGHDDGEVWAGDAFGGGLCMTGSTDVRNCLIVSNSAQRAFTTIAGAGVTERGAGVWLDGGNLVSCTVADNRGVRGTITVGAGGGIYQAGGTVRNCIVSANTSSNVANNFVFAAGVRDYSCAPELTSGTGNTTNAPGFQRKGAVDYYRVSYGSPCQDSGTNLTWMTNAVDLAGTPRIVNGRVNMGAFEFITPAGTGFIFR